MTWLKLDDGITEHPKCAGLSANAWCLWIHGLTYCSRNMTDGLIPVAMLPRLSSVRNPDKAAAELVDAGLWHKARHGWNVHDYLEHQRSRAEVEDDRRKAGERQARARARKRKGNDVALSTDSHGVSHGGVTEVSRRDKGVSHGGSHGDVTAQETETETETDVVTPSVTVYAGSSDPDAKGKARRVLARLRASAHPDSRERLAGEAAAALPQLLADFDAPDDVLVSYLLGETANLGLYRK